MSINLEQFREKIKPLHVEYSAKKAELDTLVGKFEKLANKIAVSTKHPDDIEDGPEVGTAEYQSKDKAYWDEHYQIEEELSDLAYELGMEWNGSFSEGAVEFWEASTC